jgi:predicted AAA+ superfamily ATPase
VKTRIIAEYLREKLNSPLGRIIVLTGARQTGKTTAAELCFPGYRYLSIEDPVQRQHYRALTASQWEKQYPLAILDEVQKEPSLIESIKAVYDQYAGPRYVLLGSSQFLLLQKVRESLAGRCVIVELYPLTLPELLIDIPARDPGMPSTPVSFFARYVQGAKTTDEPAPSFTLDEGFADKKAAWDFYLKFGGYPALTDTSLSDSERREYLDSYVRTFLERDIHDLASFRDLEPFTKLQRYLAHTTGQTANYSSIAKETGVTVPTVQRYIRYMELSYQALVLPAWFSNPLKKLVKMPKVHFLDNGVLQAVLQKTGLPTGNEFESAVVAEIYKQIKTYRLPLRCYYLRTHDGREVDLLLESAEAYIAIEIKMSEHINHTDIRHLRGLASVLDKPLRHSFVVSNDPVLRQFEENITALHAAAFLT